MAEMEGGKHSEIKFERQRSHSVPIISQIEKLLPGDRSGSESASFKRETKTKNRRFSETRSPKNTTSQKSLRKLSSGGLMRNQKRGHVKTAITERKQTSQRQKQGKPRASITDITTNPPRAVTHAHSRRKRSKSLPLTRENFEQEEEIGCSSPKQKQTSKRKSYNKVLRQRSMSLPTCLQHEPKPEHSKKDLALSSTMNTSSSANFERFVFDFKKLSFDNLQQSEQEKQDICSIERRKSWPFCLKKSNHSMESSVQISANFNIGLKEVSLLQKPNKISIQRSKSLPLTGLSCDGEVRTEKKLMKDEVSREDNGSQHKCGFRHADVLGEIILRKEHSGPREKSPRTIRSKSLPLGLEIESETNMSPNLMVKHLLIESLQSCDKLQDAIAKRKRTKSLPCIYERFNEKDSLCKAQNIHHLKTDETDLNQKEKIKESEEITGKVDGNIERTIPLKRARSLPSSLAVEQHQSGNDHIGDDTKIKSDGEHQDFIGKERPKSLPNILEGERSLSISPVVMPELLEEDNDIPEAVTTEENICNTVSEIESEEHNSYLNEGNCISNEQDENDANSKTSNASVDFFKQLETKFYKHQPNSSNPHKLRGSARGFSIPGSFKMEKIIEEPSDIELYVRARGFSIPASFKMEKIIEEPSDTERSSTGGSRCEFEYSEQNDTNKYKTEEFENNMAISEKSPSEDFTASCNDSGTVFFHDNSRGQQDERQQVLDHESDLARFDKVVSRALANVNRHEFSKSSSDLHRAAANGDLEIVKRLVEKGDDVNDVDESGWPVLHAAITTGNFDCGVWLIEAGADLINYTNFVIDEYRILSRQVKYQNF